MHNTILTTCLSRLPAASLVLLLTSCALFRSETPARTTASRPAAKPAGRPARPLKTVDTRTYQSQYVREVISVARTFTGTPYRSGGTARDGMDCSGLIYATFQTVGLQIPRISWQQSEIGSEVDVADIRPGDLLFFVPDKGKEGFVSHAGIVTEVRGKNDIQFIHASSSRGVREDNLFTAYFKGRFVKAVRPY